MSARTDDLIRKRLAAMGAEAKWRLREAERMNEFNRRIWESLKD